MIDVSPPRRRGPNDWLHGWLLLLREAALLALFTPWPLVGPIWDSFHATPKGGGPATGGGH